MTTLDPQPATPDASAAAMSPAARAQPWLMVAVCLFGISAGPAAFGLASIGLFVTVFEQHYGWSRTQISSAVSAMMMCTAFALPLVGWLVDRLGVKRVLLPSVLALGLCLLAIPFATSFWQFFAIYIAMGTIAAGSNSVPYMRALASWFDRRRGLAIGIAGSGTGLGFAYVPILVQLLIDEHGWRWGYYGLGLIMLCVTLPLVAFVLREAPPAHTAAASQSPAMEHGVGLAEAVKMRDFWLLMASCSTACFRTLFRCSSTAG
jgi:MFS family permease